MSAGRVLSRRTKQISLTTSVPDVDVGSGPLDDDVEIVGRATLGEDGNVMLSGQTAHLSLQRRCHECCAAGCLAPRDGAVEELDHLVGETDGDLGAHGSHGIAMHPDSGFVA